MNTKNEIILGIKSREKEINNLLKYYDAYLYLVVYDELNQQGNEWHSTNDRIPSIDDLIIGIENDQLSNHSDGNDINDWSSIKSWHLGVWEFNPDGNDKLLDVFAQNLNKMELNRNFFVSLMCKVHNCAIDLKNNKANENMSDTLFEVAQTLANVADQCEDATDKASNAENYGFIGIVNVETAKWNYFKTEPKHLRDVYKLTKDGYDIYHSWDKGFGFKDYNDMAILQMLTENETLSKKIGHFTYD